MREATPPARLWISCRVNVSCSGYGTAFQKSCCAFILSMKSMLCLYGTSSQLVRWERKLAVTHFSTRGGGKEPWISPAGEAGDGGSATCCWGGVWHSCGVELVSSSSQQNRPSCFPGHRGPSQAGSGHSSWSPCCPLESTAGADSTQQSDSETSKQLCSNGVKNLKKVF